MITSFACASSLAFALWTTSPTPGLKAAAPTQSQSHTKSASKPKAKSKAKQASRPGTRAGSSAAHASKVAKTAQKPTAESVAAAIEAYYRNTQDFTAHFEQRYTNVALKRTRVSRGTLQVKRPDKIRWAYSSPSEQMFVVNGNQVTHLDPELERLLIDSNFDREIIARSVGFLWGEGRLSDHYKSRLGKPGSFELSADLLVLELVPKRGANYRKVVLGVLPSGQVLSSIIFETAGNTDRFDFSKAAQNQGLKDALFVVAPPPGWEIERL